MCSIIGVGERLHKVLGQIDLGTLDSGERSLPFGLLVICLSVLLILIEMYHSVKCLYQRTMFYGIALPNMLFLCLF